MKTYAIQGILALLLLVSACDFKIKEKEITGEMGAKDMALVDFTQLVLKGAFDVYIAQGDDPSIEISGDESLVEKVEVSQSGDVLTISLKRPKEDVKLTNDLKISLTVNQLEQLKFDGAGQVKSTQRLGVRDLKISGNGVGNIELDLDANSVEAVLNFVGKMELTGDTERLLLKNEGVGNIDASKLIAKDCQVESSGIGAVSIHCTGELSLDMSGIGTVSYKGNPTVVHEKVSGIGKVNRN